MCAAFGKGCAAPAARLRAAFGPRHSRGASLCGNQPVRRVHDNSSLSHVSAMAWPRWFRRAARNRHRQAIEQASRRWRGGRRCDSARTRRKILISTQVRALGYITGARRPELRRRRVNRTGGVARTEPRPDRALGHHVLRRGHWSGHGRRAVERGDVRGGAGEVSELIYVRLTTRRRRPSGGHTLRNNALASAYGAPGDLGAG